MYIRMKLQSLDSVSPQRDSRNRLWNGRGILPPDTSNPRSVADFVCEACGGEKYRRVPTPLRSTSPFSDGSRKVRETPTPKRRGHGGGPFCFRASAQSPGARCLILFKPNICLIVVFVYCTSLLLCQLWLLLRLLFCVCPVSGYLLGDF